MDRNERTKEKEKKIQKKRPFFYMISSWKQNTPGLNFRKVRISFRDSFFRFQNFLYCRHSKRICLLVSME